MCPLFLLFQLCDFVSVCDITYTEHVFMFTWSLLTATMAARALILLFITSSAPVKTLAIDQTCLFIF